MLGKSKHTTQRDLFPPMLIGFIDMRHELVLLGEKIDWKKLGNELSVYYSNTGRSSMPVRLMAGCLILKRLYDLGDEALATVRVMNPYMQYFCGERLFQHRFPTYRLERFCTLPKKNRRRRLVQNIYPQCRIIWQRCSEQMGGVGYGGSGEQHHLFLTQEKQDKTRQKQNLQHPQTLYGLYLQRQGS